MPADQPQLEFDIDEEPEADQLCAMLAMDGEELPEEIWVLGA